MNNALGNCQHTFADAVKEPCRGPAFPYHLGDFFRCEQCWEVLCEEHIYGHCCCKEMKDDEDSGR